MKKNVVLDDVYVIDNFYSNPDSIRKLALQASYNDFQGKANFAGMESEKAFYNEKITEKFEKILNKKIKPDPKNLVYGKFRYSVLNDKARTSIHFDKVEWAAIIYLTPDDLVNGGLNFYSLKKLSLSQVPPFHDLWKYECSNFIEFDEKYVMKNTKDINQWELLDHISAKYNRLVLFKGNKYFHSVSEQFGNDIHDARMTQVFFFNESEEI